MLSMTRRVAGLCLLAPIFVAVASTDRPDTRPAKDTVRVLVRVPPADMGRRQRDEAPAEFRLRAGDFGARRLDPASLQVVRCEAGTGKALSGPLPIRWY